MIVADAAWQQVRRSLYRFVAARLSPDAAVEDVVQDVLARMVAGLDDLRDTERLNAWAYRIARNAIIDEYRRRPRQPASLDAIAVREPATPDVTASHVLAAEQVELVDCLRPMVEVLDDPYRQALTLTAFDGLTDAAAAHHAGVSLPAMKSRVRRARRQLREQLTACCLAEPGGRGLVGLPVSSTSSCGSGSEAGCGCASSVAGA